MNLERWQQIEALFRAASERGPEARATLLAGVDPELRREVEALLAQESQPAGSTMTMIGVGTQLGPYKIEASLGAGGMGQVFRGRDTRLNRAVAIKVVDQKFSERFEREALAISALNHPNVCTLHDVGPNYLVMELVEGDTLAARLKKGPLATDQVLSYGAQIADALAAAHAKGIVHRDLKPGNIMLTKNAVKVLDFGLAKSQLDRTMTASNVVIGTPAYMAPEQMEGKEADARTDIYALGLVLYEIATGTRAVPGQLPPMEKLPRQLGHVIESCLAPDPNDRWQTASDVKRELEWAGESQPPPVQPKRTAWLWPAFGAAALLLLGFLGFSFLQHREGPAIAQPVRFEVEPPEGGLFGGPLVFVLSPDGRRVAFHAVGQDGVIRIWVRSLDSTTSGPVPGTSGSTTAPFWSPDSRFVAIQSGGGIQKFDVSGGQPQTACGPVGGNFRGGTWSKDDTIIYGTSTTGLFRCSGSGGAPTPLTELDASREELFHGRPVSLPDAQHFLYVRYSRNSENTGVYAGSIDDRPDRQSRTRLLATRFGVAYAPSANPMTGHLLFLRGTTLVAQSFDVRRLGLMGEPFVVAEQVGNNDVIFGYFSASENATLAYRGVGSNTRQLTWFDRQGKILGKVGGPAPYLNLVSLSPDEKQTARSETTGTGLNADVWLVEFARGLSTRFTFNPAHDMFPVWSPDGSQIAFDSSRLGRADLYKKASNGTGDDELLFRSGDDKRPISWSADGRLLLYRVNGLDVKSRLWVLPLQGERKPTPLLETGFNEDWGRFSPDSHWIAYQSDESGKNEVYMQPFDASAANGPSLGAGRMLVSKDGGERPRWRRDGRELFYQAPDRKVMAVEVTTTPTLHVSVPQPLFQLSVADAIWDVSGDGRRFLVPVPVAEGAQTPITVVLNWTAGLK